MIVTTAPRVCQIFYKNMSSSTIFPTCKGGVIYLYMLDPTEILSQSFAVLGVKTPIHELLVLNINKPYSM